jgi:urease accessory protein
MQIFFFAAYSSTAMQDEKHSFIQFLQLLQLADSTLPIGATAHSFGLETLVEIGVLQVPTLEDFLRDYLQETGRLEAAFCRTAYNLAVNAEIPDWLDLNIRLSAFKPARETRIASATLGRRFLQLVTGLGEWPLLTEALAAARAEEIETHHCMAFGLVGGVLGFAEEATALAYLQQSIAGLVSACQRLLPLGQSQASRVLWNLKPAMIETVQQASVHVEEITCFNFLPDIGGMQHPVLATRLFIS